MVWGSRGEGGWVRDVGEGVSDERGRVIDNEGEVREPW